MNKTITWISVKAALPICAVIEDVVLARPVIVRRSYLGHTTVFGACFTNDRDSGPCFHTDEGTPIPDVTHWAYMPEGPDHA